MLMYCNKCGNKLEEDWKCCPKCGLLLNGNSTAKVNEKENKNVIIYMTLFILSIISIIIYFVILKKISILLCVTSLIIVVTGNMRCPHSKVMSICLGIYVACVIVGISALILVATCQSTTGYLGESICGEGFCNYMSWGEFWSNIITI